MKVHFSLSDPTNHFRSLEVGVAEIQGEVFVGYTPSNDAELLSMLFPQETRKGQTLFLRSFLEEQHVPSIEKDVRDWHRVRASIGHGLITNLGEYLAWLRRYHSIYVSLIEDP